MPSVIFYSASLVLSAVHETDSWNGKLLAVWNPILNYQTRETPLELGRTPLVYAVSGDEGPVGPIRLLEDDPDAGYCYCAVHFLPDAMLLALLRRRRSEDGCVLSGCGICWIEAGELED